MFSCYDAKTPTLLEIEGLLWLKEIHPAIPKLLFYVHMAYVYTFAMHAAFSNVFGI